MNLLFFTYISGLGSIFFACLPGTAPSVPCGINIPKIRMVRNGGFHAGNNAEHYWLIDMIDFSESPIRMFLYMNHAHTPENDRFPKGRFSTKPGQISQNGGFPDGKTGRVCL